MGALELLTKIRQGATEMNRLIVKSRGFCVIWVLMVVGSFVTEAQSELCNPNFWVTNRPVNAIVQHDNTIYIGGEFTQVGPRTGCGVMIDTMSGLHDSRFPEVNDSVNTAVPDGAGGWYIGGDFTYVGGISRNHIAHILSDGSVDPLWDPNANCYVNAIAISPDGGTIYAGGSFAIIGGKERKLIAALDSSTGQATQWNPVVAGDCFSCINAVTVSPDGAIVYVGGNFSSANGQSRNHLVALDTATGEATAWNPNAAVNSFYYVNALALSPCKTTIYVGGCFSAIGGDQRENLAEVDLLTGGLTPWNPNATGIVEALAVSPDGKTVYAGGQFISIGGERRNYIAALDAFTGQCKSWCAQSDSMVESIAVSPDGTTVYCGGWFSFIGGQARNCIAALDAFTGRATAFDPNANDYVEVLAVSPDGLMVYAGGQFTSLGGMARNRVAALDATTGKATAWNPNASGSGYSSVFSLAVSPFGTTVYAGGCFASMGGEQRHNIAALSTSTGLATEWNPNANAPVFALAVSPDGRTVYTGGDFTSIGGEQRHNIAALSTSTGLATEWNPNANAPVFALAVSPDSSTVYAGGDFTSIGGQARSHIAALDAVVGKATAWNPGADGTVNTLFVFSDEAMVFADGEFLSIGGQKRNHAATLDAMTGNVTDWNPCVSAGDYGLIKALVVSQDMKSVYVGGWFRTIGHLAQQGFAAFDLLPESESD
jgi:WD40 repeat protein